MIDAIEPLSLVLWGVFFLAAGMYPLGFMLGSLCSLCCEGECEPLFYRCLRQKSVDGSVTFSPSRTIFFLREAGIIKASSTASAVMQLSIQPHGYLSEGESVVYVATVRGYGEALGAGVQCPGVSGSITVRVEGRGIPLKFNDLFLGEGWAGSTAISLNGIASTIVDDRLENYSAALSASVVGVTVTSASGVDPKQYLDGTEVTEAILRGMITVSQPYFDAYSNQVRLPKIAVSFAGDGTIFRYIREAFTVRWLVQVNRGPTTTYFQVSVRINRTASPPSVPEGMTQATIPSLPAVTDTPMPDDVAPVVTGTSVLAKGHRIVGHLVSVPITLQLVGRCTVDVNSFYLDGFTTTGTTAPPQLGLRFYANGSAAASRPMDKYVFRIEHLVNEPAGEEYDFDKVGQYRRGEITLPVSYRRLGPAGFFTDKYEMQIVEPSPLCGMNICSMPQDLLPQGITYTPAAGTKWDCKDAYPIVLGNPRGGCLYSHEVNECRGSAAASINLFEFYTPFKAFADRVGLGNALYALDALSWLEFTPDVVTKPNGTYEITGTYDAGAGRYGKCYTASAPSKTFSPGVGGVCQPAEYTVTLTDIAGTGSVEQGSLSPLEGDYILSPVVGGCWGSQYYGGGRNDVFSDVFLTNFYGDQYSGVSPNTGLLYLSNNYACDAQQRQAVAFRASFKDVTGRFRGVNGVPVHNPPLAGEWGYDNGIGFYGSSALITFKISTSAGQPMTQCNNVTFSPTAVAGEAGKPVRISIGTALPGTTNVAVSGEKDKCGYGVLVNFGGEYYTDRYISTDVNATDLQQTIKRTLVSDGSPPQVLTITLPGKCQTISLRNENGSNSWPLIAPADGGCVVIVVVPSGNSCAWTATGGSEWAVIDEETQSGTGVGLVKINVSPQLLGIRSSYVTVSLADDPTITVRGVIYQAR